MYMPNATTIALNVYPTHIYHQGKDKSGNYRVTAQNSLKLQHNPS